MSPLLRSASILALAAAALAANADIVVVAPTSTAAGSFTITAPITFNVTAASTTAQFFVLQGLVSADDRSLTGSNVSPNLAFRRNGVPVTVGGNSSFLDNVGSTIGAIAARDGLFAPGGVFTVAVGDTVTLDAATYGLTPAANFNPLATQTFTGDVFLANGTTGVRLSPNVSAVGAPVPEPASMAVLGLGAAALLRRRKRRA